MTKSPRFFWRLFAGHAAPLLLAVVVVLALMLLAYEREYRRQEEDRLKSSARAAASTWDYFAKADGDLPDVAARLKSLATSLHPDLRLTIVAADGRLLADSQGLSGGDAEANGLEIADALRHGEAFTVRWSYPLAREFAFAAARVGPAGAPRAVVRASLPSASLDAADTDVTSAFLRIALGVGAVGSALAAGISLIWSIPLTRLIRQEGSGARSVGTGSAALDSVAMSLHRLREDIAARHAVFDRQQSTLEELLSRVRDGVVVANRAARIVLMNPAAVRLLDLSADGAGAAKRFIGMPIEACVPLFELQAMLRMDRGLDEGEDSEARDRRVEIRRRGGSVFLLARSSPIRLHDKPSEEGEEGRLLVLTDVTELSRVVQVKSDLVANASHELRTPIAAIRMAAETVRSLDPVADAAAMKRCVDVIDRQTGWLEELVRDLLDLSKLEAPSARFHPQSVDLPRFCEELVERFAPPAEKKRTQFIIDGSEFLPCIHVHPGLLRMVLDNLVDNALKFTAEGGRVRLAWRAVGHDVEFVVEDNGCGIPTEDQARVFERFYQVERARSGAGSLRDAPRGTGLGLSIVRHAVLAMNGHMELESVLGKGTKFTVTLPRVAGESSPPPAASGEAGTRNE
ncbi:MAG: PAS domain-containing protein [Phycisphaerales bacterium]|nr:PAS domain-containing protein [Phycisphaerales bacterium]